MSCTTTLGSVARIAEGGSKALTQSQVLPTLLEEALHRGRQAGRSQLYTWLIIKMQAMSN